MNTPKYSPEWWAQYATKEDKIREDEIKAHDAGECEGFPLCVYCIEDWGEHNREELDRQGYYDSKGHWTK